MWANASLKKAEIPAEHLVRECVAHGPSVMVAAGVSFQGICGPYFVDKGCKIDAAVYVAMPKNQYQPDIAAQYPGRNYVFHEDGAPAHTANKTKAWVASNMPATLKPWPPTSPDLNVMDFYAWPRVQLMVEAAMPQSEPELKVAIKKAFAGLKMKEVRAAISAFIPRAKKCVEAGGGHFEYKL